MQIIRESAMRNENAWMLLLQPTQLLPLTVCVCVPCNIKYTCMSVQCIPIRVEEYILYILKRSACENRNIWAKISNPIISQQTINQWCFHVHFLALFGVFLPKKIKYRALELRIKRANRKKTAFTIRRL